MCFKGQIPGYRHQTFSQRTTVTVDIKCPRCSHIETWQLAVIEDDGYEVECPACNEIFDSSETPSLDDLGPVVEREEQLEG